MPCRSGPAAPTGCRAWRSARCSATSTSTSTAAPPTPTAWSTLFVLFLLARRIVHSPFGLSLMAIRRNPLRASALGVPIRPRLIAVYTLSAAYAGAAGALLAQTTAYVSLEMLEFQRSADVLLTLIIGGTGWLYGGIAGAIVFKILQDVLSSSAPQFWMFWMGHVPRGPRAGRPRAADARRARAARQGRAADGRGLETRGLGKRFGGLVATNDVTFRLERGARHALIGPNGAGKTTFVNLLTGVLAPSAGRVLLGGEDITRLRPEATGAPRPGAHLPDQPALRRPDAARDAGARRQRAARSRRPVVASGRRQDSVAREVDQVAARFGLRRRARRPHRHLALRQAAAARDRRGLRLRAAGAAARRAGGRRAGAERRDILDAIAALPADVSVLLIEHDMDLVFSFAQRISVLVDGALLVEGTPAAIDVRSTGEGGLSR